MRLGLVRWAGFDEVPIRIDNLTSNERGNQCVFIWEMQVLASQAGVYLPCVGSVKQLG